MLKDFEMRPILVMVIFALHVVSGISRAEIGRYTTTRTDTNHCNQVMEDTYSCWIGKSMLSRQNEFYKMLKSKATTSNLVILSFVDHSYVDMAVNLHESFKALRISNFIFICADEKAFQILKRRGISAFLYQHSEMNSDESPEYYSDAFILKVSIKIKILTAAIMHGFHVLFTDADVVFLRDPIPYLASFNNADLVIQNDTISGLNSGFLLVRPTYAGVTLMVRTLEIVMTRIVFDQDALNLVIDEMMASNSIAMVVLDIRKFPCGKVYFEDEKRMFLEDRFQDDVAYIVHNNFLQTKVYIFIKYNNFTIKVD